MGMYNNKKKEEGNEMYMNIKMMTNWCYRQPYTRRNYELKILPAKVFKIEPRLCAYNYT